jgi:hypothetical protein
MRSIRGAGGLTRRMMRVQQETMNRRYKGIIF